MKTKEINLAEEIINILPTDDLFISVKIGGGQIGGTIITSNNNIITKGVLTELTSLGKKFTNGKITVRTNILDVNAYSNSCVINTTITNQDNKILYSKILNENAPANGILSFINKFLFKITAIIFLIFFINIGGYSQINNMPSPSLSALDNGYVNPGDLNSVSISLLGILKNGGNIEFSPYWLFPRQINAKEIYMSKFPILQYMSISAAALKIDSINNFAAGARTIIYQFRNKKNKYKIDSLNNEIQNELINTTLDTAKIEYLRKFFISYLQHPTINVEINLASGGKFFNYDSITLNRYSIWSNFNYHYSPEYYFSGTFKISIEEKKSFIDTGISFNYDKNNYYFGIDMSKRFIKGSKLKVIAMSSIKINDFIYLSSAIGRNFNGSIIAIGGINIGFSIDKLKI